MNQYNLIRVAVCGILLLAAGVMATERNPYGIFPEPLHITGSGQRFPVSAFVWEGEVEEPVRAEFSDSLSALGFEEAGQGTPLRLQLDPSLHGDSPERYRLEITPAGITVTAPELSGLRYGLRSLLDTLKRNNGRWTLPELIVDDAPACAMRGIFMNLMYADATAPDTIPNLKRLFRALAGMKYNTLMLEFGANVHYRSPLLTFPEKKRTAFSPEQIKSLVAYARGLGLEVIPYAQMISHCTWITYNADNYRFVEGEATGRVWGMNWCPRHPEITAFVDAFLDETVELFDHPAAMNVGLDEVSQGNFGICERCRGTEKEELLYELTTDLYQRLQVRGMRMIAWEDAYIFPNDYGYSESYGWNIVDRLPKDIIWAIWYYDTEKGRAPIQDIKNRFHDQKGFPVIGAGAYYCGGFQVMGDIFSSANGGDGILATHWYTVVNWADYTTVAPGAFKTVAATAAYGWNPALPYHQERTSDPVFELGKRLYEIPLAELNDSPRVALELPYNASWESWLGADSSLSQLPPVVSGRSGRFEFKTTGDNVLQLHTARQQNVEIPVGRTARYLQFIQATSIPTDVEVLERGDCSMLGFEVGRYIVKYEDGSESVIPLVFRDTIADWNNRDGSRQEENLFLRFPAEGAGDAQQATSPEHPVADRVRLGVLNWINPYPERLIRTVRAEVAGANADFVLAALTALP